MLAMLHDTVYILHQTTRHIEDNGHPSTHHDISALSYQPPKNKYATRNKNKARQLSLSFCIIADK
jgi:hypothetical protein